MSMAIGKKFTIGAQEKGNYLRKTAFSRWLHTDQENVIIVVIQENVQTFHQVRVAYYLNN